MNQVRTLVAALFFAAKAAAQSPALPVEPGGNLLNRAPEFARWTIEEAGSVVDPKPGPSGSPPPEAARRKKKPDAHAPAPVAPPGVRTTVVKTGSIFHLQSEREGGEPEEKWCQPNLQATLRPGSARPLFSVPGNPQDAAYVDFSKSDFPDCAWVSRKNYVGVEQHDDCACLVFRDRLVRRSDDNTSARDQPQRVQVVAYVDYYSRLPVALIRGDTTQTYHYGIPPQQLQVIPDEIAQAMKQREQTVKELSLKPAKPF